MARGGHSASPRFFTPIRLGIVGVVVLAAIGLGLLLTSNGSSSPSASHSGSGSGSGSGSAASAKGTSTTGAGHRSAAAGGGSGSGSGGFAHSGLRDGQGTTSTLGVTGGTGTGSGGGSTAGGAPFSTQAPPTTTTTPSSHTCDVTLKQYGANAFGATYTSNGPAGGVVTIKLSKGSFDNVTGGDQNGQATDDATSTTDSTGTARFLFSTSSAQPGHTKAYLYASSSWCSPLPVAITV